MAVREHIIPGTAFGGIIYLKDVPTNSKLRRGLFLCQCGKPFESRLSHVKERKTLSCGCHRIAVTIARSSKHGNARRGNLTPEYTTWSEMKKRCENSKHKAYPDYGGRGISFCVRWGSFENFLADMGKRPGEGFSIDRIDPNGNYEPGNCRWASCLEQANNKRTTPMFEYQGRTQSIADWARELGFCYWSLRNRLVNLGWTVEKAFKTPAQIGRNQYS